jgi:hypothetical protein
MSAHTAHWLKMVAEHRTSFTLGYCVTVMNGRSVIDYRMFMYTGQSRELSIGRLLPPNPPFPLLPTNLISLV